MESCCHTAIPPFSLWLIKRTSNVGRPAPQYTGPCAVKPTSGGKCWTVARALLPFDGCTASKHSGPAGYGLAKELRRNRSNSEFDRLFLPLLPAPYLDYGDLEVRHIQCASRSKGEAPARGRTQSERDEHDRAPSLTPACNRRISMSESAVGRNTYAVACLLQKEETTRQGSAVIINTVTSMTLSVVEADSEETAIGHAIRFAQEEKPGFAIADVLCKPIFAVSAELS